MGYLTASQSTWLTSVLLCFKIFEYWDLCAHESLGHGRHPQSVLPPSNSTPTCRLLGLPLLWNMTTGTPSDPIVFIWAASGYMMIHVPPPKSILTGGVGRHSGPLQYTSHLTPWNEPYSTRLFCTLCSINVLLAPPVSWSCWVMLKGSQVNFIFMTKNEMLIKHLHATFICLNSVDFLCYIMVFDN